MHPLRCQDFSFYQEKKHKRCAIGDQLLENRERTQANYRAKRARCMSMDFQTVHGKFQEGGGAMLQDPQGVEDDVVDDFDV